MLAQGRRCGPQTKKKFHEKLNLILHILKKKFVEKFQYFLPKSLSEKSAHPCFSIKMESHVLSLLVVHDVDAVVLSAFNVYSASATIYLPFFPLSLPKTSFSSITIFL